MFQGFDFETTTKLGQGHESISDALARDEGKTNAALP
jgi:hypothetical protein